MTRLLALTTVLLLGLASPALAAPKDEVGALLFGPWFLAVVAYPVGLALHLLMLGFAPRRGAGLVHKVEAFRGRTLVLGAINTLFFFFVFAALGEHAPKLAALVATLWVMLALVGSHGLARSIGARVLDAPPGTDELKALALGWFILCFASALPGLGWLLAIYWSIRATGGVVLTLFSVPDAPMELPKDLGAGP